MDFKTTLNCLLVTGDRKAALSLIPQGVLQCREYNLTAQYFVLEAKNCRIEVKLKGTSGDCLVQPFLL